MSARPEEALTRWLLRQTDRAAALAGGHETFVDVAVALLIAVASFVGLAIQGRLRQPDTIVFCFAVRAADRPRAQPVAVASRSSPWSRSRSG